MPTLGSNLRFIEFNHISLLDAPFSSPDGTTPAAPAVFVPTASNFLFSSGMSVVLETPDPDTGSATLVAACVPNATQPASGPMSDCKGSMSGSAFLPPCPLCPLTGCAVVLNFYAPALVPVKTTAAYGFDANGNVLWASAANFVASTDQPNPLVDKWTNRIYFTGIGQQVLALDNFNQVFCIDGNKPPVNGLAQSCDGYGDPGLQSGASLPDLWPRTGSQALKYGIQWIYGGTVVPAADRKSVDRLLYSMTLSEALDATAPIGCLFSASTTPNTVNDDGSAGSAMNVLDSYCITRDSSIITSIDNYLASAPVLYINGNSASGNRQGSVAFVIAFDCIIYAFDPRALAAGPLYALNPLASGSSDTVATDYLAVSAGGSLLFSGWDDNDNEYSIWAVPGVTQPDNVSPTPSPTPSQGVTPSPIPSSPSASRSFTSTRSASPTPAPAAVAGKAAGLGAGAGAGITIAVLVLLGGGGFYFVNAAGGVNALIAKVTGQAPGAYGAFGSNIGLSKPSFGAAYSSVKAASATSGSSAAAAPVYKAAGYNSI